MNEEFRLVGVKVEDLAHSGFNGFHHEIPMSISILLRFHHDRGDADRLRGGGILPVLA